MSDVFTPEQVKELRVCEGLYETTGKEIARVVDDCVQKERQRCLQLILDITSVYLPGYVLERLVNAIEKGE